MTAQNPPEIVERPEKGRRHYLLSFTFLLLLIAIVCFFVWYIYFDYFESTDDAYANGNMININSVVSGAVVAFYAEDTELVTEGQLLVKLDTTPYQVAYDKAIATLAATVLETRELYDNVHVNQANVEKKNIALSKARYDFNNRSSLVSSQAISNEDFQHSKDDLSTAENDAKMAEYQLKIVKDAAGITPVEYHPNIEKLKEDVKLAYYNVHHCDILAPFTGYVAQRRVQVGEWAEPTLPLMAIIPTDYVWVDANFKETQLSRMRIGQHATVWFDLYGSDIVFDGNVMGIGLGTGSVFSLIPPQNATGNWIKIVQRIPVRITLDPEKLKKYPMRMGISANVQVDIENQNLPILDPTPATKPIAVTRVFDIDMEKINKVIDETIKRNLQDKVEE